MLCRCDIFFKVYLYGKVKFCIHISSVPPPPPLPWGNFFPHVYLVLVRSVQCCLDRIFPAFFRRGWPMSSSLFVWGWLLLGTRHLTHDVTVAWETWPPCRWMWRHFRFLWNKEDIATASFYCRARNWARGHTSNVQKKLTRLSHLSLL